MQWVGLVLVLGSAFWPLLDVRSYPGPVLPDGTTRLTPITPGAREIPAQELGTALVESIRGPDRVTPLWSVRRWYPWYLAPVWVLALVLGSGVGRARRRLVGVALLLLSFGVVAFEAAYLKTEYLAFFPGVVGRIELGCVWLLVIAILLYRRPADRHMGAVEASVAAQALLGFVHGITLPATMFRQWLAQRDAVVVLEAVLHNFKPAFWIGMAGMLIMALPVYLRRTAPPGGLREEGR